MCSLTFILVHAGELQTVFSPHFLFGVLEALSHKVDGLVLCDWVFLEAGLVGVEGLQLGLVCQTVLKENSVKNDTFN